MSQFSPLYSTKGNINKIQKLLTSIETKQNYSAIKTLQGLIKTPHYKQNLISQQECPYYLDLVEIDQQMQKLQADLQKIVQKNNDKRLVSFYQNFESFASQIFSLQPTTLHMYSTKMKKHLLSQIQFQKQKRIRAQTQLRQLLQIIEQSQVPKQNIRKRQSNKEDRKLGQFTNNYQKCNQCSSKDFQISELLQSIKRLENLLDKQRQQNSQLNSQIRNLQRNRRESKLSSARDNNSGLFNQIDQLQKQKDLLRGQIRKLNQIISNLNDKLYQTQAELNKMGNQNSQRRELQSSLKVLQLKNKQLEDDIALLRKKISSIENQKNNMQERVKNLNSQLQQKQKNMNNLIESMERRKFEFSENLPSRMTQDLSDRLYGTASSFKPKDNKFLDLSSHKIPSDYNPRDNNLYPPSNIVKKPPRNIDYNVQIDNDELLRMLLIQACSLQKFLIQDLSKLLLQQ